MPRGRDGHDYRAVDRWQVHQRGWILSIWKSSTRSVAQRLLHHVGS